MLINWLLYPLLLTVASLGHGLLVRRVLRGPSSLLLLPTGFGLMIIATTALMGTGLHRQAWLGIVVPAALGLVIGRGEFRGWRDAPRPDWLWPAAAAVGAFAIFALPILASGRNTLTGYTMITDIANHFDLTARLVEAGNTPPPAIDSSYAESVRKLMGAGYPTGLHSLLGAWSELLGRELAWMYQPTISFAAPMGALAAFGVLRFTGLPPALRTLGAAIVVMPTLLYSYGLVAGFKELFAAVMILSAVALLIEAFDHLDRRVAVAAVPIVAGFDAFAAAIAPWIVLVVLVFFVAVLLRTRRLAGLVTGPRMAGLAVGLGALAWALLPSIQQGANLSPGVETVVTSQSDLGNLAAPLDPLTSVGIWLTGDYRLPLTTNVVLTHALIYVALALALLGAISAIWNRRPEIVAVAVAAGVTLLVVLPRTGPWVDAKIFAITGTLVLTLAFFGMGALAARRRTTPFAWILAVIVGGGVLYGNALAVNNQTLAPDGRLRELERIGHRFSGQGAALAISFDEYAEYFLRQLRTTGRVNPPNGLPGDVPQFGADIDSVDFNFLETFNLIVLRRNPVRSRPPSNYKLVYRSHFYDVWRQTPRGNLLEHHALPTRGIERTPRYCGGLVADLKRNPEGRSLLWTLAPDPDGYIPTEGTWAPNWSADRDGAALRMRGPGHANGVVRLRRDGRYQLWEEGSFERPVQVRIDGRLVGTLEDLPDYSGESVYLTTLDLTQGTHRVELRRGGGSLRPGSGDATGSRYAGPLYFVRSGDQGGRMFTSPVGMAKRICNSNRLLDWVELKGP